MCVYVLLCSYILLLPPIICARVHSSSKRGQTSLAPSIHISYHTYSSVCGRLCAMCINICIHHSVHTHSGVRVCACACACACIHIYVCVSYHTHSGVRVRACACVCACAHCSSSHPTYSKRQCAPFRSTVCVGELAGVEHSSYTQDFHTSCCHFNTHSRSGNAEVSSRVLTYLLPWGTGRVS